MKPNPDDGRSKRVWLTDAGRAFREEAIARLAPDIARIEEVMGADGGRRHRRPARTVPSGSTPTAERGRDFEFAGQRPSKAVSPFEVGSGPMRPAREATKASTSSTGLPAAISDTMAEPTTQPSATPAIASAVRRLDAEAHDHRQVGRALIRATSGPTSPACASAAPVIPVIET
jgi:hypothetical protein